jgi:phosphoribosylcarboxyaminoimidazole (NCAIR) mutase
MKLIVVLIILPLQMPKGIPVATVAIGIAENAGLLAARILAARDPELQDRYGSLLVLLLHSNS